MPYVGTLKGFIESASLALSVTGEDTDDGSIKFTAIVVEDDPGALHWNGDAGSALPVAAQDHTVLRIWEMNPGFQDYLLARCNFEKALGYAYITDS